MSIHIQVDIGELDTYYVGFFDDPKILAKYVLDESNPIRLENGFSFRGPGNLTMTSRTFLIWYRFTTRGMLIGYVCNPSGSAITLPNTEYIYYTVKRFDYTRFQMKMYFDCIDFELYNKNPLPYFFTYTGASEESCISRIENLLNLTAIQYKAFKDLTVASYVLLPYTFFNTYKFDFNHTMYNEDGSLKESAIYYPSMFASGGTLKPQYFPQPTKLETE